MWMWAALRNDPVNHACNPTKVRWRVLGNVSPAVAMARTTSRAGALSGYAPGGMGRDASARSQSSRTARSPLTVTRERESEDQARMTSRPTAARHWEAIHSVMRGSSTVSPQQRSDGVGEPAGRSGCGCEWGGARGRVQGGSEGAGWK